MLFLIMQMHIIHAYACRQRKRYREAEKHLNTALTEARRIAPPPAAIVSQSLGSSSKASKQSMRHGPLEIASYQFASMDLTGGDSPQASSCTSFGSGSHASSCILLSMTKHSGAPSDAASTVASIQYASACEEVQQLVFRATVEIARCYLEQGRMQEAVWFVSLLHPWNMCNGYVY